ncbi:ferric/cupric-chelate reductase [Phytophthora pseudosyringae]|uniref:Ferric/cupric-chelate reductase n=1 Tax=Phytophthora pseudosyringae TaxID=221518 RepID=A0A8T1W5X3_9STRA|nr:ferric/cupric-chelate reductase [Phytophthora pseudosyringae]
MSVRVDMERRRTPLSPPRSPETDPDLDLLLDQDLDDVEFDHLVASRTPPKGSTRMRLLQKPQKAAALQMLSKARRSGAKVFLTFCSAWVLFGLLWIRWPLYYREVFPSLETRLGDKLEVEPFVVSIALVFPFLLAGAVFYWKQDAVGSLVKSGKQLTVVRWVKSHPSVGKNFGFDAVDVVVVGGFLLLQLNLVVGKLLIDKESGKLAKAGYLNRTARAFGMNGLYAMVLSVVLVARRSFLHKFFGLSGERAARYHVLTGQFGFIMLALHGVLYILVWYMQGKVEKMLFPCLAESCTPKERYGTTRNFFGAVAMIPLLLVAVSSMEWVRRRFFQRFIVLHCLSAVSMVFTALHYYAASFWLVPAIVLYGIYRTVSAFGRGKSSVVSATAMSNKIFQLELRRSTSGASDFLPGQYVYIKVDAIGNQWHPFTISSSPLRTRHSFVLDAKVQGPFTSQVLTLMKMHQLNTVHVDGYYGSEFKLAPHMIFVAGGSGMTPFLSVLDHLKALAEAGDRDDVSADDLELPRTLWVIWTCRDMEFLEAHAELLDAVNRCSRWKCKMWLHLTHAGCGGSGYDNEDDDTQTEPDDLSEEASPRAQKFYPSSLERHTFSGHSYMLGLPLFVGTALGCVLLMLWVIRLEEFTAKSFIRRTLLLGAGVFGTVFGGCAVLYSLRRWNARKNGDGRDGAMGVAIGEMEVESLDVSSPAPPATPRSMPTPAQSVLSRNFLIEKERPDLGSRLRDVHGEIRENYGMKAEVALLVSGPADLQSDALLQARELQAPAFEVHQKSFLL